MWDPWRPGLLALFAARRISLDLIWATALLVGAIFLLVMTVIWVRKWTLTNVRGPADSLDHYRALFDQGELSSEEYERVRRRLEQRVPPPTVQPGTQVPEPAELDSQGLPPADPTNTEPE